MKKAILLTFAAILVSGQWQNTNGQSYQSATDVIYGQQCFVEVGGKHYATGDKNSTGSYTWPSRSDAQVCYYLHVPQGYVCMSAFFNTKAAAPIRLRVSDPDNNKLITENELATSGSSSNAELQLIEDVQFPADKWYRFEFSSSKPSSINSIVRLEFKRESTNQIVKSTRYMAASTHLWVRRPNDPLRRAESRKPTPPASRRPSLRPRRRSRGHRYR